MKRLRTTARTCATILVAAMVLQLTGGHWAILQSVAWARMIVVFARTAPLTVALQQTFDGRHPCPMCRMIEQARQAAAQQSQSELQAAADRDTVDLLPARPPELPDPPAAEAASCAGIRYTARSDPPPVPPPRPGRDDC